MLKIHRFQVFLKLNISTLVTILNDRIIFFYKINLKIITYKTEKDSKDLRKLIILPLCLNASINSTKFGCKSALKISASLAIFHFFK